MFKANVTYVANKKLRRRNHNTESEIRRKRNWFKAEESRAIQYRCWARGIGREGKIIKERNPRWKRQDWANQLRSR